MKAPLKKAIALLFMLSLLSLSGCGKKGPLYLPDDAEKKAQYAQLQNFGLIDTQSTVN